MKSLVIATCAGVLVRVAAPALADASLFVLRRDDAGFKLTKVVIAEGQQVVWTLGQDGFVDVILPPGPGGSAGITQAAGKPTTTASCKGGQLSVITTAMGKKFERPAPTAQELAALDVHVSARGADGKTFAGFIRGYSTFEEDKVGVVEDPFGNAIPLQKGDCVIYTSTFAKRDASASTTTGKCPVQFTGGHHLASAQIGSGSKGAMVIDLAAGTTVVAKSALPPGTVIRPSEMVEHSPEGIKRLASEVGGATGAAMPLGVATLDTLTFGDVRFENVDVLVMEELPPVANGIIWIVGLDLLGRGKVISIPYPAPGTTGELRLSASASEKPVATLPLAILDSRAYCRGKVNAADVCFIVASGSPITIVEDRVTRLAGLQPVAEDKDVRGIGTARSKLAKAGGATISLGESTLKDQTVMVGSLPLFARFKGATPVGILGNETLAGFGRVEMDFERGELRLYRD